MAEIDYCEACEELKATAPNLVANGFTNYECANLGEGTGLSGDSDNCTDLNNLNDCLIGTMKEDLESSTFCDWQSFIADFISNVWTVFKAVICAVCGLWSVIADLKRDINVASYVGLLTLYTSIRKEGDGSTEQSPAFDTRVIQGNLPSGVLSVSNGYKGITVNNTTSVPLLVEATFNCSIYTRQNLCCCYILVTRDGVATGQTPFITPDTYDQQVSAEPFILQPGESSVLQYYFRIGRANDWFISQFGGTGGVKCVLDENASTHTNQRSYFEVKASSIVEIEQS